MKLLDIVDYDIVNYKDPSMFLIFTVCRGFKCEQINHESCPNRALENMTPVELSADSVVERYNKSGLTRAIVCGGLEPFDTPEDLLELIDSLQKHQFTDTLVIFTGYNEDETDVDSRLIEKFDENPCFDMVIKFGRYVKSLSCQKYDNVLGIDLASENQYAVKYSKKEV